MEFIKEPNKEIPVAGSYDVIVVGGGIAGVAAAVAAARGGAKTLVIEKSYVLGGLATSGLVNIYLPLCDGRGKQVCFGLAEELIKLSVAHGYEERSEAWFVEGKEEERKKERYLCTFNANMYALQLEELLLKEKVDILYGTLLCDCSMEGKRIAAVITENKSGRQAYKGKYFIDCSGDADLGVLSGAPTAKFGLGNLLAAWYVYLKEGVNTCKPLGVADNLMEKTKMLGEERFEGLDGKEISEFTVKSHQAILEDYLRYEGRIDEKHALTAIASIPQLRMTRRVVGEYESTLTDNHKYLSRSIGMFPNWRTRGEVYELPYECLYTNEVENVSFAGRCISTTDEMWDLARVIPVCAVSGQAAGLASALCLEKGYALGELPIEELQAALVKEGVILHEKDL